MKRRLQVEILPQPDDSTCGPTCLHSIYRYYGDHLPLEQVIKEVRKLDNGGTLAVFLACHALKRGYRATIYTYNLHIFDPTWFGDPGVELSGKLAAQAHYKDNAKLKLATQGYLEFLELGGAIRFQDISGALLKKYLNKKVPVLTGLSATYLYGSAREVDSVASRFDDVRGEPSGHFVVLTGYDKKQKRILIADPYGPNPFSSDRYYHVDTGRLINSILLGIVTYDANFIIIEQGK